MTPTGPGCPWSGLEQAALTFCEENTCGWLSQPANSISSFAYVAVGIAVYIKGRDHKTLKWFGALSIMVGLTSFIYHATYSFIGELMDVGSMYLFSALLLVLNLERLKILNAKNWRQYYLLLIAFSLGFMTLFHSAGIWWFGCQIAAWLLSELKLYLRNRGKSDEEAASYRDFRTALTLFFISYGIWQLDYHHVSGFCKPENHILQGHAAWHIINSFCFFYLYRFYRQFPI